jgi:hypothetical protein
MKHFLLRCVSPVVAHFGHGGVSDLSPRGAVMYRATNALASPCCPA